MSEITTITDFIFNEKQITLKTSKFDEYMFYAHLQTAGDERWDSLTSMEEKQEFIHLECQRRLFTTFRFVLDPEIDFPNIKKIIDVGSGIAHIDLLLSQILPNINFYLLDKTEYSLPENQPYYSKSLNDENYHGFYNSFDIVKDIVQHSPINPEQINFLSPEDEWPTDVDLIMSMFSWMWHYPKDVYWGKLLKSLKIGGYFSTTMTIREGENIIEEISKDLGSYPCHYQLIIYTNNSKDKDMPGFEQTISHGWYVWKRLR